MNTLYISCQLVPEHSCIKENSGGTGNMLSLTTRSPSFKKCPTLDCAPPEQCTIPWIDARGSASSTAFTTGAYVLVGESTCSSPSMLTTRRSMDGKNGR